MLICVESRSKNNWLNEQILRLQVLYFKYDHTIIYYDKMSQRITIILDDDLVSSLRQKQAKLIKGSSKSVSFSRVLNETLRKNLKK